MQKVCHFLRKDTQLRASFINNQITNHIAYMPYVVYRIKRNKLNDGGFADFNKTLTTLDVSNNESKLESLLYKLPKLLSSKQSNEIEKFLNINNIEIAHFHYGTDCGVFFPFTKRMKIPFVVSFYGYDCSSFPQYLLGYGKRYLTNRVFKNASKVLAMSPDMKNDLIQAGCPEDKIIVHYYGTDTNLFNTSHQYPEKKIYTFLILSNLVPKKGHLFLLKSIERLINKGVENFHLRIVGGGELDFELKDYVNASVLTKFVTFVGAIKYGSEEMMQELKNADVFVHPSIVAPNGDKEGIPGTIIEAMSAGLPVVSTYHAGIPYIMEHRVSGILVRENDTDALADSLKELIGDKILRERIGLTGQRFAIEHLDLLKKEKELETIYDQVIQEYKLQK